MSLTQHHCKALGRGSSSLGHPSCNSVPLLCVTEYLLPSSIHQDLKKRDYRWSNPREEH